MREQHLLDGLNGLGLSRENLLGGSKDKLSISTFSEVSICCSNNNKPIDNSCLKNPVVGTGLMA